MKLKLFLVLFFVSPLVVAADIISGHLERDGDYLHLTEVNKGQCKKYLLSSGNVETHKQVIKLTSGDFLTGVGSFNHEECRVVIEALDYVGLRRLLGHWYSEEGIVSVKDFNSISFYSVHSKTSRRSKENAFGAGIPTEYRYSLMPTEGAEWVVFLSDSLSTTFATIQFFGDSILMRIFHSETGDVTKVLHLSKWGAPRK